MARGFTGVASRPASRTGEDPISVDNLRRLYPGSTNYMRLPDPFAIKSPFFLHVQPNASKEE